MSIFHFAKSTAAIGLGNKWCGGRDFSPNLPVSFIFSQQIIAAAGPSGIDAFLYLEQVLDTPRIQVIYGETIPQETLQFNNWTDEVLVILEGKAEITYTSPPWHKKKKFALARKGDVVYVPKGTWATWKTVSKEPMLHISVIAPSLAHE